MAREREGQGRSVNRVALSLERLESRVLLSVLTGTGVDSPVSTTISDADGDSLLLTFAGPTGATVEVLDTTGSGTFSGAAEDDIGSIEFTGTDANSYFIIEDSNVGVGGDTIDIAGGPSPEGVFTDAGEDMGLIAFGLEADGTVVGVTSFGAGVGVDIGGALGAFATSGDLDFDTGATFVDAGGDIGLIVCDEMVLSGGTASISAGPGGSGNVSLLMADSILTATGGAPLAPRVATPGSPVTVADDAGAGTTGSLTFVVASPGGTASIWSVPVTGGGSVVTEVTMASTVVVRGRGTSGDVTFVDATTAGSNLLIAPAGIARDIDVGWVEAEEVSLGRIVNNSPGGDIFAVSADGAIRAVVTGPKGNIGALFTGDGNSTYLFPQFPDSGASGVSAGGDIGVIRTGSIVNALIETPGSVNIISTGRGGLLESEVMVGGDLNILRGRYVFESDVEVAGAGTLVWFGSGGVNETELNYLGGLGRAVVLGEFDDSYLSSVDTDPVSPVGGGIGSFFARGVTESDLEALGGFGTVRVVDQITDSYINTSFWDPAAGGGEGAYVGGGIDRLIFGGMIDSGVDVYGDVRLFRSGTMTDDAYLDVGGSLAVGVVASDLLDSWIDVDGDLTGLLFVNGDVINDSSEIDIGGSSNRIIINGSLAVGDGIDIGGDSRVLIVRGGGTEGSDIYIGGSSTFLLVGWMADYSEIDIDGDSLFLRVRGGLTYESEVYIGGDSRTLLVGGTVDEYGYIGIDGDSTFLRIGGNFLDAEIDIDGASGVLIFGGNVQYSDIDISGDSTLLVIHGSGNLEDSDIDIDGDSGVLRIEGNVQYSDIWIYGDSTFLGIGGHLEESDIEIYDGSSGVLRVGGNVHYSDIYVDDDSRFLRIGGVLDESDIDIYGMSGFLGIGGNLYSADIYISGASRVLRVTRNLEYSGIDIGGDSGFLGIGGPVYDSDIDIDGSSRVLRVGQNLDYGDIYIGGGGEGGGSSTFLFVGSSLYESGIYIDGASGVLRVGGNLDYSDIDIGGGEGGGGSTLLTVGGALYESDIDIGGASGVLGIGENAYYSDLDIGGDSRVLRVSRGFSNGDIYIGGDSTLLGIGGSTYYSDIDISGSSTVLWINRVTGDSEIDIGGDSGLLSVRNAEQLDYIDIGGSARRIFIGGDGGAIDGDYDEMIVGGDLGSLVFGRGLVEYYIEVGGDVSGASMIFNGSITDVEIEVDGRAGAIIVRGSAEASYFYADGGFGRIIVAGTIVDSEIESRAWDVDGLPIGGGIDVLSAAELEEVDISLHGSIGILRVARPLSGAPGLIDQVTVDLTARDSFGGGDVVGGGGIRWLLSRGLLETDITTYGRLARVQLGSAGINEDSSIETLDATTGDLSLLTTGGLVFGDLKVAGSVGSILTGGAAAAVPIAPTPSPIDGTLIDRLFVDAGGAQTGGSLAVDGAITGTVS